jgi:calcium-translocating P-type ATPase
MIGLTEKEVIENRKKHGNNMIDFGKKDSFIKLLLASLGDPIIKILIIALAIKTIFLFSNFDWYETIGILVAIFIASFVSTISEYGNEKAFEKLQEESSKIDAKVTRNKKLENINIDDIVVNDLVILETGDEVPADGIIVEGSILVNESSLNGEMREIHKEKNMPIYRSSVIYAGRAYMRVTKVGKDTYYGKLAKEVSEKTLDSPLKIRLTKLAKVISKIGYVGAILVSFSYLFSVLVIDNSFNLTKIMEDVKNFPLLFGHILHALTLSVTIIVVAVPEGLPMMITLVLSSNMKKMLKSNVLVRKMTGIETAGNINILFTDKTGTITKGVLEVTNVIDGQLNNYNNKIEIRNSKFMELLTLSLVCNNASDYGAEGEIVGGNITDRALLSFIGPTKINYKVINRQEFNSKIKMSKTEIKYNNQNLTLIKGAPEVILNKCSHYYDSYGKRVGFFHKDKIEKLIKKGTLEGKRVIALATENNGRYTFLAIIFIKDEVRKEACIGLDLIKKAHINTVMVTGDNEDTAKVIGREAKILTDENDIVLTSKELNEKSDDEIKKLLPRLKIVARALPQDKSRLVRLSQEMDLVVGMTGDGVNDAAALKKADVGFSMGSGTEVAKEASDIVILDDNLLSISNAILYGRTIFKSIRKFIIFQLTVNICAVGLSIIGPFIGVDTPVTVIQMLWINMVMDTLAAIAFSYEPALLEYMDEKPKKKDESIVNQYMKNEILFTGTYSFLLCILFLKLNIFHTIFESSGNKELLTAFFGLFIFISIFNCFNARTHRLNIFANLRKNPVFLVVIALIVVVQIYLIYYGGSLFRTYGLSLSEFEIMILLAFSVVPIDFLRKLYLKKRGLSLGV